MCAIQERLFTSARREYRWVRGTPLGEQQPIVAHRCRGMWSSTRFLAEWSKTPVGIETRKNLEIMIEGKETSDLSTGERMLARLHYEQWAASIDDQGGRWLLQLHVGMVPLGSS